MLIFTRNFVFDFLFISIELFDKALLKSNRFFFEFNLFLNVDNLIRDCIELSLVFKMKKNLKLNNLSNIAEFNIVKTKKKLRKLLNKKELITRTKKKIVNSTKRNFLKFEYVKQNFEIRVKRAKKIID